MSSDAYILGRGDDEVSRLNTQGLIFESLLDYQIHPSIRSKLPQTPTIADVGTGTGSYLIRLSEFYPAASNFHGFDISGQLFPAEGSRPDNVKFHVHDVRVPFPPQFHGKFNFIHLRMLVAGMERDDWATATRNLIQLLKPGGALQWEEGDIVASTRLRGGKANMTTRNLDVLCRPFFEMNKQRFSYGPKDLIDIFQNTGLGHVEQDLVSNDRLPEYRKQIGYCSIDGVVGWAKRCLEEGVDVYPGRELAEVVKLAYEDLENGAYSRYDIYVAIGFKSS